MQDYDDAGTRTILCYRALMPFTTGAVAIVSCEERQFRTPRPSPVGPGLTIVSLECASFASMDFATRFDGIVLHDLAPSLLRRRGAFEAMLDAVVRAIRPAGGLVLRLPEHSFMPARLFGRAVGGRSDHAVRLLQRRGFSQFRLHLALPSLAEPRALIESERETASRFFRARLAQGIGSSGRSGVRQWVATRGYERLVLGTQVVSCVAP